MGWFAQSETDVLVARPPLTIGRKGLVEWLIIQFTIPLFAYNPIAAREAVRDERYSFYLRTRIIPLPQRIRRPGDGTAKR